MEKLIRAYIYSGGSLLLALATIVILANLQKQPIDFVPARDMVFNLPLPVLFWTLGGMLLIAALLCLFGRQTNLQLTIVLWLAINLFVYRIGLYYMGAKGGVQGYLGEMGDVFGLSIGTMSVLLMVAMWYLVIGSVLAMTLARVSEKARINRAKLSIKMACAQCGGHIQFFTQNLGQRVPCPHCQATITLCGPENLRSCCYFCKGHIEFPAHALGHKTKCPHCRMDITLQHVNY